MFNCPFDGCSAALPTICNPKAIQLLLKRTVGLIVFLIVLTYVADTAFIHLTSRPFETVSVQPLLQFPMKDGKTMYVPGDPYDAPCVRSLFPHFACQPCWYLNRHKKTPANT